MPELPEVETIVRELRQRVLNRRVARARLLKIDMLKTPRLKRKDFEQFLEGKAFRAVERRGKFMLFSLNNGGILLTHLGMTGKFVVVRDGDPQPKHLCSQYIFADGRRLDHIDVRRFGRLEIYGTIGHVPLTSKLGPDPLAVDFGADALRPLIFAMNGSRRRRLIHPLLLDQTLLAGVGNIYAAEALFRAGIKPQKRATKLRLADLRPLADAIRAVLNEAIAAGGTTVNDYRRVDDKPGNFRVLLSVYGREGEACKCCGTPIRRIRLGGRSAFYCPKCQK